MRGKKYVEVMTNLYNSGWSILDNEDGWSRFVKYVDHEATIVMEISYADGIIVDVYKYTY